LRESWRIPFAEDNARFGYSRLTYGEASSVSSRLIGGVCDRFTAFRDGVVDRLRLFDLDRGLARIGKDILDGL
jgi:hypothetical protein